MPKIEQESYQDKNILVTGGSGFIGRHLITELNSKGANVYNFSRSNGDDLRNYSRVMEVVRKKFDIIFHLAGKSGVNKHSESDIIDFYQINVDATKFLLSAVAEFSPNTKLILSGTRLEYGKPIYLPVDEKHPTNPNSIYGQSKLEATKAALLLTNQEDIDITVIRASNVYGLDINQNFQGYNVINHFIELASQDQTINIFGEGKQIRDYIHISDLIRAFLSIGLSESKGEIFNLGYGKGISLEDMTNIIINKIGKGRLIYTPWPKDYQEVETGDYISDISKISQRLQFIPEISFEDGIEKSIPKL